MSTKSETDTNLNLDNLRSIIDNAVKNALSAAPIKKRRGRKPKAAPAVADTETATASSEPVATTWFADAWHAFINDETPAVSAARDNDMRASFKSWLGKHKEFHKKKISDSYYNLLVSQKLRRVYVMKETQAA